MRSFPSVSYSLRLCCRFFSLFGGILDMQWGGRFLREPDSPLLPSKPSPYFPSDIFPPIVLTNAQTEVARSAFLDSDVRRQIPFRSALSHDRCLTRRIVMIIPVSQRDPFPNFSSPVC